MDRLSAITAFVRVVEHGGFSEAARRMGVAKSAVSKHIAALESHLGARLLDRTTRRVTPTEAGTGFYERARRILADLSDAEAEVAQGQEHPRGLLRVSAPMTFGVEHLSPMIADFMTRYEDITIDLQLEDRFVDILGEGLDVAVRVGALPDSSLRARRLGSAKRLLLASPAYLAAHGRPNHPDDLVDHEIVEYTLGPGGGLLKLDGPDGRRTLRLTSRYRSNNGQALVDAAVAGLGLLTAPSFVAWRALRSGALVTLLDEWMTPDFEIHALYPPGPFIPPKLRVFIDYLAERCVDARWDLTDAEAGAGAGAGPATLSEESIA